MNVIRRYADYTDDLHLFLTFYDNVLAVFKNLRAFRSRGLTLPKEHPAYGMMAATENGDLCATSIQCGTTFGEVAERHSYDGVVTGDTAMDCHTSVPMYDINFGTVRDFMGRQRLLLNRGHPCCLDASKPT